MDGCWKPQVIHCRHTIHVQNGRRIFVTHWNDFLNSCIKLFLLGCYQSFYFILYVFIYFIFFHHHSAPLFPLPPLPISPPPTPAITTLLSVSVSSLPFFLLCSIPPTPTLHPSCESVSIFLVSLFCSLNSTHQWNHMLFAYLTGLFHLA